MSAKRLSILVLFLCAGSLLQAQPKKIKLDGEKCRLISISDPGEFYSTYDFTDADLQALQAKGIKSVLIDKIVATHTEATWPSKLGSLDERIANPDIIKSYTVYAIAELNNMVIMVAPAKYNTNLPDGWKLTNDVFFIVSKKGVTQP